MDLVSLAIKCNKRTLVIFRDFLQAAVSSLHEMAPGTHFQPVLGDSTVNKASVSRVVFCSGKHYYALTKQREAINNMNTAIVRLEVSIYARP